MMDAESSSLIFEQNCREVVECGELQENAEGTSDIVFEEEYSKQLQDRILLLRRSIQTLKQQLQEEREIWQKEIGESDYFNVTSHMGLGYYSECDCVLHSHFESRQNIQKELALANYKRRLLEVENMCTLELMRVKQSVQILQPLQLIAKEWKLENQAGDFVKEVPDSGHPENLEPLEGKEVGAGESPRSVTVNTSAAASAHELDVTCSLVTSCVSDTNSNETGYLFTD